MPCPVHRAVPEVGLTSSIEHRRQKASSLVRVILEEQEQRREETIVEICRSYTCPSVEEHLSHLKKYTLINESDTKAYILPAHSGLNVHLIKFRLSSFMHSMLYIM
jgi:hypothetical protein